MRQWLRHAEELKSPDPKLAPYFTLADRLALGNDVLQTYYDIQNSNPDVFGGGRM